MTLTVRDEYGLTGTATQTLTMTEPTDNAAPLPVINPPSCVARVCNYSGVGTTDPNTGDTFTYLWNFGDGTPTSTSSAPSHTFAIDGTYIVSLTVTDGWGDATTVTRSITLTEPAGNANPVAVISNPVCSGLTCNLSGLSSSDADGDAITYSWNFGDATTSTSSTPSKTWAAPNTYTVTLTVTDGWGNQGTTTRSITVA